MKYCEVESENGIEVYEVLKNCFNSSNSSRKCKLSCSSHNRDISIFKEESIGSLNFKCATTKLFIGEHY